MDTPKPKGRGKPPKYTSPLCHELKVRLSDDMLAGLDWLAQRQGLTRAEMVRAAVDAVIRLSRMADNKKP